MNSDLIPSSQASTSPNSEQTSIETVSEETKVNRQQPIPPPSEPMQYRAIGLVRGRYQAASTEQFTQGVLVTEDGAEIQAVLLGRIISLVRNHLDLAQEHLWVVYPRTGQKDDKLHLQIVGVWEPEKLSPESPATQRPQPQGELASDDEQLAPAAPTIEDGYFSVRGEVVFQSTSNNQLVVKIKQAPRKESEKPKYFKLKLQGTLKTKAVGQFWDLQIQRQAENLVVQQGESIAVLPKPKPRKNFQPRSGGRFSGRSSSDSPRPVRKTGSTSTPVPKPVPRTSTPKPQKRPKPPQ
jgi:hypothetical protein